MNQEMKLKSIEQAMEEVGKLPVALPISEAERKLLVLWIGLVVDKVYDEGYEDGKWS